MQIYVRDALDGIKQSDYGKLKACPPLSYSLKQITH